MTYYVVAQRAFIFVRRHVDTCAVQRSTETSVLPSATKHTACSTYIHVFFFELQQVPFSKSTCQWTGVGTDDSQWEWLRPQCAPLACWLSRHRMVLAVGPPVATMHLSRIKDEAF